MFENNEDMYARLGKPYKFYMMFHGEHGWEDKRHKAIRV
jgi:hypothetical protein